jgi:hypothetical protein
MGGISVDYTVLAAREGQSIYGHETCITRMPIVTALRELS